MEKSLYEKFAKRLTKTDGLISLDKRDLDELDALEGRSVLVETEDVDAEKVVLKAFVEATKSFKVTDVKGMLVFVTGGSKFNFEHLEIISDTIHKTANSNTNIMIQVVINEEKENQESIEVSIAFVGIEDSVAV